MAKDFVFQVFLAVIGIEYATIIHECHGINGQVAAYKIIFQANIGCCMDSKTFITVSGLITLTI
jgi:hypothetical protein